MPVPALSEIEAEVVALAADGHAPGEIAEALRLSPKTVEWHVARARRKLERAASLHDRLRDADPADPDRRRRG